MNFIIEYKINRDPNGEKLPALLTPLELETMPMCLRQVTKALDAGIADEAVVYVPVRVLRASRKVEIADSNGKPVAVDAILEDLDSRIRPVHLADAPGSARTGDPGAVGASAPTGK